MAVILALILPLAMLSGGAWLLWRKETQYRERLRDQRRTRRD